MTPYEPIEIQRSIQLGGLLGEGGMGRVLDGFAPDLGQHLAIKQLHTDWMQDNEVRSRFEEEAGIMASIDHPGVLPVYGIGLDAQRRLFYVMKKVEGQTLGKIIADTQADTAAIPRRTRLLGILLDVCETVAAAHRKGIIHRDLKPENLLIDGSQSVFVIDWGLAKRGGAADSGRTIQGKVMGTPGYMAPEQADGRSNHAGATADVFALGVILYEILTGRRPFAAETDRAEMLGAIHQEPLPPRRINWLLPRDISAICLKALQKEPQLRYPDAAALAGDLRAHMEGRPVSAIRPNLAERVRFAARKNPMRAVIVTAAITALALTSAFLGSQRWADHRLAEKAIQQLSVIELEIAELESEKAAHLAKLAEPTLPASERPLVASEIELNNARWMLAQFEAYRTLRSVVDLRFIRTDSSLIAMTRNRLLATVEASIERGNPELGQAITSTYLERAHEGTLQPPLSPADLERLRKLAEKAARASRNP
jgi:serine/threonine protein kinase